jgi:hypothetical protein
METHCHNEGAHVEFDKETFKKMFPNLANELETNKKRVAVNSVRTDVQSGEKAASEEIIAYLEKRGEIKKEYAEKLKKQLEEKGVRSFGSKKEENHYFKHGGL